MTFQPKLSRTDMTKIRTMRKHGMTYEAIGKQFGVTDAAIYFALERLKRSG